MSKVIARAVELLNENLEDMTLASIRQYYGKLEGAKSILECLHGDFADIIKNIERRKNQVEELITVFAEVQWSNFDIQICLEEHGISQTEENVQSVREKLNIEYLEEQMISTGYDIIRNTVRNVFELEDE